MLTFLVENIGWLIGVIGGLIVWGIRLEGVVKSNRQRQDMQVQSLIQQMAAEFATRDVAIKSIKEETEHLTRMGENIKDTLNPLMQKVAGLDAKIDIILERLPK